MGFKDCLKALFIGLKERRFRLDVRGKLSVRVWWIAGTVCAERWWCTVPRSIPGQVGWGPWQPDLVAGNSAHSLKLDGPWGPFQPKLFYDQVSEVLQLNPLVCAFFLKKKKKSFESAPLKWFRTMYILQCQVCICSILIPSLDCQWVALISPSVHTIRNKYFIQKKSAGRETDLSQSYWKCCASRSNTVLWLHTLY